MGVGILHLPLARTDAERRTFLNSIGPVWDGNEVWLVLGGRRAVRRLPARLRLAVLRLLPRVHAGAARDDPADGRHRVPQQGARAALAIRLGHRRSRLASVGLALLLGVAFGNILSGVPLDADGNITVASSTCSRRSPCWSA